MRNNKSQDKMVQTALREEENDGREILVSIAHSQ